MKNDELRDMSDEQLELTLKETRENLFRLRMQAQTERLDAPSELRRNRRLIARIKTIAGQKAVISGYHDSTGDPLANAELAKQRAMKVRDTLVSIGVAEDKVELKKPEQMAGDGPDARRVDVVLM